MIFVLVGSLGPEDRLHVSDVPDDAVATTTTTGTVLQSTTRNVSKAAGQTRKE